MDETSEVKLVVTCFIGICSLDTVVGRPKASGIKLRRNMLAHYSVFAGKSQNQIPTKIFLLSLRGASLLSLLGPLEDHAVFP